MDLCIFRTETKVIEVMVQEGDEGICFEVGETSRGVVGLVV